MKEMVERVTAALKANMGQQMSGRPLLGDKSSTDWHADGDVGTINLENLARAAIAATRFPEPHGLVHFNLIIDEALR